MKRILVVNVNWLGDVLFSAPVFRALKRQYPDAHIACMAVPRVKEILESISAIDEIIEYDERGYHRNPLAKFGLILKLRRRHFDSAFLLHRSLTRALLVFLAGIPQRVGYDAKGRGKLLTHIAVPPDEFMHRSDQYIHVIESFGIPVPDRRCLLDVAQKDSDGINRILEARYGIAPSDPVVILNPGGNWDLKRWPAENFVLLTQKLLKDGRCKVVISGAHKDIALGKVMTDKTPGSSADLSGQTSLKQLLALMKRACIVVSGDSGPLHLANSVGTDVIGLYGPTRPEITGPRGTGEVIVLQKDVGCNREPCYHLTCPDNICMKSIRVDDVYEIIQQRLR